MKTVLIMFLLIVSSSIVVASEQLPKSLNFKMFEAAAMIGAMCEATLLIEHMQSDNAPVTSAQVHKCIKEQYDMMNEEQK